MQITNYQLLADNGDVIQTIPKLATKQTIRVWEVPTDYQADGYFISNSNAIPACDHGEPIFTEELEADEELVAKALFNTKVANYSNLVQIHLDTIAKAKGYDSLLSACSYANSVNTTFKADGLAAVAWRDEVWVICHNYLQEVEAGTKLEPSEQELISLLPTITW